MGEYGRFHLGIDMTTDVFVLCGPGGVGKTTVSAAFAIKLALEGLLDPDIVEDSIGKAIVKESFKIPKVGIISGAYVEQGKVIKNSLLRVLREDEITYEGNLTSLKRFKEDVNEVKTGFECGIGVSGFYDFEENDVIEVYAKKEVKRTLK